MVSWGTGRFMPIEHRLGGFTLIELMIVMAVIAVIAAIAVPIYQTDVARTHATAGLAEIAAGEIAYETLVNEGVVSGSSYADVSNLGLSSETPNCSITATAPASGSSMIQCVLKGTGAVSGHYINLVRNGDGTWSCVSDLESSYRPRSCMAG